MTTNTEFNARLGSAIEYAAKELPGGYEISIEVGKGSASAFLWIAPPAGYEFGRRINSDEPDLVDAINALVEAGIEDYQGRITK